MKKVNADAMRSMLVLLLAQTVKSNEMDVLPIAGGAFSVPVVAEDGEEGYATVTVVMRDKNRDGEPYDGYADKANYEQDLADRKAKEEARALASKAKQEARAAKDAAKAKAKADAEAATEA